jgi:hypothetical protein
MAKQDGGDVREIEASLDKDFEREGGYRSPKEPQLLRRGGTLIMAMSDSRRIDAENVRLKAENESLKKQLAAAKKAVR